MHPDVMAVTIVIVNIIIIACIITFGKTIIIVNFVCQVKSWRSAPVSPKMTLLIVFLSVTCTPVALYFLLCVLTVCRV
jgi:hypothetical protein